MVLEPVCRYPPSTFEATPGASVSPIQAQARRRPIRRRHAGVTAVVLVALLASLFTGAATSSPDAAAAQSAAVPAVEVTEVAYQKPSLPKGLGGESWKPGPVTWPAGKANVTVPALHRTASRAGDLPIWIARTAKAKAPSPVSVEVLNRAATSRARVDGLLVAARVPAGTGSVSLTVGYRTFRNAFGGALVDPSAAGQTACMRADYPKQSGMPDTVAVAQRQRHCG